MIIALFKSLICFVTVVVYIYILWYIQMQNYTSDYKIYAGACIFRSAEAKPIEKSHLLPSSNSIGIFLKDLVYYYGLVHIIYI